MGPIRVRVVQWDQIICVYMEILASERYLHRPHR